MIKIGLLATLVGPYQHMGEEAVRGAQLALAEFDHHVGGQPIELVVRGTNAIADSAVAGAAALLDEDACDLIVGPLSGDEGVAIREYAKQRPEHVFVNGTAASQTIFNPAPNFYTFNGSGAQWMAGLGQYCFDVRGYRRVATIGDGYSFPFAQVGAFSLEFIRAGGQIAEMIWAGLGTEDYMPYIERIPDNVDAVLCVLAGLDGVQFIHEYRKVKGNIPIIAGQAFADTGTLEFLQDYGDMLVGTLVATPVVYDNPDPNWSRFVEHYRTAFPDALYAPSQVATAYYTSTKAALLALEAVDCDLSADRKWLQQALAELSFDTPTGPVSLDHHNNGIITNFIGEIEVMDDGTLYTRMIQRVPAVNATLGLPEAEYLRVGNFSIHNMPGQNRNLFQERLSQHRR